MNASEARDETTMIQNKAALTGAENYLRTVNRDGTVASELHVSA